MTVNNIFKSVDFGPMGLKRTLSTTSLITLGISSTIGSGIYVVIGVVAKQYAGMYVILCFLLAGVIALSNSLAYTELSCRYNGCGGIYTYIYKTWGVTQGFLIGWLNVLGGMASISIAAETFSSYINQILLTKELNVLEPNRTNTTTETSDLMFIAHDNSIPGILLILFSTLVLISGNSVLFSLSRITTSISILALVVLVFTGIIFGNVHNIGFGHGKGQIPCASNISMGTAICYFAYTGFSVVCSSSEEAKHIKRSIPKAIIYVMSFVGILYCCVAASVLMLQPYWLFDVHAPLLIAVEYAGINWMRYIIMLGVTVGLIQVNFSCLYQVSRLVFSLARDGLLPSLLGKVYGNNTTPVCSVITCGLLSSVVTSFTTCDVLISITIIGIFVNSVLANFLILWINCYSENTEFINIRTEQFLKSIHTISNLTVSPVVSSSDELLGKGNSGTVLLIKESDIEKNTKLSEEILMEEQCITHNVSSDLKVFQQNTGKSIYKYLKTCYVFSRTPYLPDLNTDVGKWHVIIVFLALLNSCIFLAGTFIIYASNKSDFKWNSLVTVLTCGITLICCALYLSNMKCSTVSNGYNGIRMIMVPYLPILNIFINIYMLLLLSDSIGALLYILLLTTGLFLFIIIRLCNVGPDVS